MCKSNKDGTNAIIDSAYRSDSVLIPVLIDL